MFNYDENEVGFIIHSEDNLFPEWLFEPFTNDFGDNYYEQSFVDNELLSMIKRLRRRYADFFEWVEAMSAYTDYMNAMVKKYGSMRIINNALEAGLMDDTIPSKPKLKNSRKNKDYLIAGVLPSKPIDITPPQNEEILAVARQVFPDATGEDVNELDNKKKLTKEQKRRFGEIQKSVAARMRRKNMYRSVGNNRGTDFIVDYLNQAKKGIYNSNGEYTKYSDESILDIVKDMERIENTPEELLDNETDNETVIRNGRLVRKKDEYRMQIYEELYSEGYDIFGGMTKGMDKSTVKMIRTRIGANEPMTKKEMKKYKKKQKKDARRVQKQMDENAILERTLLGNKISNVGRDSNGNISLRLRDLFKDDE